VVVPSAPAVSSLGPAVIAVVLVAALLHATWNAIAHSVADRLTGFALIGIVDFVGGGVLALFTGLPPAPAWPYIVASAAIHIAYNLLLLLSYRLGEFSQAYPLARGVAPLVVAVVSIAVFGRALPVTQVAGVLLISLGLIVLVLIGGLRGVHPPALAAAFATGLTIAAYTVVDALGVALSPLLAYIGWMFFLQGPALPALAALHHRRQFPAQLRAHAVPGLLGGAISLAAYSLVLWAQTSGAMAPVAALRETSIVFGAVIGALFLGERLGHRRALAATVVLSGVVALSLPA
jgi:drug/metabolite transporter (DMT)-like permease